MTNKPTDKPDIIDDETLANDVIDELTDDGDDSLMTDLQVKLEEAETARLRSLADYQNLVRRTQMEKASWSKLATQDFVTSIIEPLEHLQMASEQLGDSGLKMVVKQLFDRLSDNGLEVIDPLGKAFDAEKMEAIAGSNPEGKKVSVVVSRGYQLNGVLLVPAKVKVD